MEAGLKPEVPGLMRAGEGREEAGWVEVEDGRAEGGVMTPPGWWR